MQVVYIYLTQLCIQQVHHDNSISVNLLTSQEEERESLSYQTTSTWYNIKYLSTCPQNSVTVTSANITQQFVIYQQPSAGCKPKQSTVKSAHMYVRITMHECPTQYGTEQF